MSAPSAAYLALQRIWASLPDDRPLSEVELRDAIIAAGGLYGGDHAGADARRAMLIGGGALRAERDGAGRLLFRRGPFPEYQDAVSTGPGSELFNERLRAQAREERERRERGEKLREQARANLNAAAIAAECRAIDAHIDRRLRELGLIDDHNESALAGSHTTVGVAGGEA